MASEQTFRIKRGDRFPVLEIQAYTQASGPVNLASVTNLRFLMRASGAASTILSATLGPTVINASQGQMAEVWQSGDIASGGYYQGEFEGLFPAGYQTFPTNGYIPITVNLDLGGGG